MSDVTRHDFTCFPSGRVIGLDAMREWEDLPDNEKQKTRVGGGCVRF